jgi:phospholipase/carboxylesterase
MLQTVEVEARGVCDASVIWLHGLGADGHDFEPIVPMLRLDHVRFVFPHAPMRPVTLNGGHVMRAWYDIRTLSRDPRREDEVHIREAAGWVEALVHREIARGVPSERIVLAGFSQGGAMALHVAHRLPVPLAGILALSTYLVCEQSWDSEGAAANALTPALCCHGLHDEMVPIDRGRAAYERLATPGRDVRWRTWPMGHAVCDAELRELAGWLHERLPKVS